MATLTDNGSTTETSALRRPWIKVAGTWGSGTITVKINGVSLATTYTANFELQTEFERPVTVVLTLAGATGPNLVCHVL